MSMSPHTTIIASLRGKPQFLHLFIGHKGITVKESVARAARAPLLYSNRIPLAHLLYITELG